MSILNKMRGKPTGWYLQIPVMSFRVLRWVFLTRTVGIRIIITDVLSLRQTVRIFDDYIQRDAIKVILDVGSRDALTAKRFLGYYRNAISYAFECNPDAIADCRHNIKNVRNVHLVETAVTDFDGTLTFHPVKSNIGVSSIFDLTGGHEDHVTFHPDITVPSTRLDTWAANELVDAVDIIWMDLQGAELKALKGMGAFLKTVKAIHVEVSYQEVFAGAPLYPEVRDYLEANGFMPIKQINSNPDFGDVIFVNNSLMRP